MVSIVIPVYNRQAYIEECIRSVQAQTYRNYEILLIDDGSTDDTLEICRRLAQEIPQIRILESDHVGVSAARNLGLDAACGDYVFFLDSDDIIHPQLLEALVTGLKNSDAAMAGTEVLPVMEKYWEKVYLHIDKDLGPGKTVWKNHADTLERIFMAYSPFSCIGGVMMRRDWIGETRFRTDLFIGEDFYFVYENLLKGASAIFLEQKWYYVRYHANNSSWNFSYTGFMNRLLRRQLVWESEDALGRPRYADTQKRWVLGYYLKTLGNKQITKEERKKINRVMRQYRPIVFPALRFQEKLRYLLTVYVPGGERLLFPLKQKLRKLLGKSRKKRSVSKEG